MASDHQLLGRTRSYAKFAYLIFDLYYIIHVEFFIARGENVEEAFLETAKKIYQNIQDGR